MRKMACVPLVIAIAAYAAEKSAITLEIKGDDGSSIIIRLLENQKYQSYMTDEISLRELDLPENFSKEKFAEVWKIAEAASKSEVGGTYQLPFDDKESSALLLRMNGQLRTYRFHPHGNFPKPPAELERVRRVLSGLTKW